MYIKKNNTFILSYVDLIQGYFIRRWTLSNVVTTRKCLETVPFGYLGGGTSAYWTPRLKGKNT